jgi:signal transduction histidine kinase
VADRNSRLAELCRDQHIGTELIDSGQNLPEVLDRTLAECERRITDGSSSVGARLLQIDSLLKLARETHKLQSRGAGLDEARQALAQLERDLNATEGLSRELEEQLTNAVGQLEVATTADNGKIDIALLGDLFGSISRLCHKINNPLTSIMGRAQMLQMRVATGSVDEKTAKSVVVIEESAKRVAGLVQELANLISHGRKEFLADYDSSSGSR